jgi:hypothetical protein
MESLMKTESPALKNGRDLFEKIGDLISGMPSDQDLWPFEDHAKDQDLGSMPAPVPEPSKLRKIVESFQIPNEENLKSIQGDVLEWVKSNMAKCYPEIAALKSHPEKWSSGPDAGEREIRRRRRFLEDLARLLGPAIRMVESIESNVTDIRDIRKLTGPEKRLFSLVKRGLRGEKLCNVADAERLPSLPSWEVEWPGSWLAAYRCDRGEIDWKKRITDLVTDLRKRGSPPKRRKLLRRTRPATRN